MSDPTYEDDDQNDGDEVQDRKKRLDALMLDIVDEMVHSAFLCLGCGGELPAYRGSWCDTCMTWEG